jgi:hypothetical protein
MAETKTHPVYGAVTVLQSSSALVQIEIEDGDSFWVTAASFIDKKKKATKPKAKKTKRVRKVDDPVDLVDELTVLTAREELPDVDVDTPEETEGDNEKAKIEEAAD